MRALSIILILFFSPLFNLGQSQNPVKWAVSYANINETEGVINITATIDPEWHIYSQRPTEAGPIPTSFTFTPVGNFEIKDKAEEENAKEEFVKAFEAKVFVFTGKAVFKQKIKRLNKGKFNTVVTLEYMTCNNMMCLPPKTIELPLVVPAIVIKK